ncbi:MULTISPECIES: GNAT family N-acetyltransferase [unclassified Roseovarius]|uniref:GNAT family N-acetyltransferase n=1 Tax=unclassified Roseovarius TaxID=2614913 RepID=UPI00273D4C61|nr:GNAT family N-acetyltransferase [Roseovarius sp. MMSF_3350]
MTPFRARLRHVPALLAILWQHRAAHRWDDLRIMLRLTRQGCVRAVSDGAGLAGFSLCRRGDLHALYVHRRAQGRGVGRVLLQDAQAAFDRLNLWVAEENTSGLRFYRRHGFAEKARADGERNDEGRPEILMVWPPERRVET